MYQTVLQSCYSPLWESREVYLKAEKKVPIWEGQTIWGKAHKMRGVRRIWEVDGGIVGKMGHLLQWASEAQTRNFVCHRLKSVKVWGSLNTMRNYRLSSILNWQRGYLATWPCCQSWEPAPDRMWSTLTSYWKRRNWVVGALGRGAGCLLVDQLPFQKKPSQSR